VNLSSAGLHTLYTLVGRRLFRVQNLDGKTALWMLVVVAKRPFEQLMLPPNKASNLRMQTVGADDQIERSPRARLV
jgi:hypothetical protein